MSLFNMLIKVSIHYLKRGFTEKHIVSTLKGFDSTFKKHCNVIWVCSSVE